MHNVAINNSNVRTVSFVFFNQDQEHFQVRVTSERSHNSVKITKKQGRKLLTLIIPELSELLKASEAGSHSEYFNKIEELITTSSNITRKNIGWSSDNRYFYDFQVTLEQLESASVELILNNRNTTNSF